MGTRIGNLAKDMAKASKLAYGPGQTGSFTGTLTGYASPPTGATKFRVAAGFAFITLPALTGTSNATTMTLTGAPDVLKPATARTVVVSATDSGTAAFATAVIGTDGVITFSKGAAPAGAWTNTGVKAIATLDICYPLY